MTLQFEIVPALCEKRTAVVPPTLLLPSMVNPSTTSGPLVERLTVSVGPRFGSLFVTSLTLIALKSG